MKSLYFSIFAITLLLFSGCEKSNKNSGNTLERAEANYKESQKPAERTPNAVEIAWEGKIETAVNIAKKENKSVLVNFTGSDWCSWCKRLNKEVFTQSEFAEYANNNLVLVKIDFPRSIEQSSETKSYNSQVQSKYDVKGYPTIVLLDSKGNFVNQTGYVEGGAQNYVAHLKSMLKKG